ncbi:MAG: MOSC domain-containing protein [candidate division NC10 bacterium]|nr:MOSC domain-containing protein [candidate division NC10 bacterium]
MKGQIVAISVSEEKGTQKQNVKEAALREGHGIEGDAHAGEWHRQVSLLALESIEKMRARGLKVDPGDFAENLTTQGLNLLSLPIGTRLLLGRERQVEMEVTQIGKVCHGRCAVYYLAGDCVMPREGIFARVLKGGTLLPGDPIEVASLPVRGGQRQAGELSWQE